MEWPARSPDLNPIENLWGYMARRVYAKGRQFRSIRELQKAVLYVWDSIPLQLLKSLVCSMKNRIFDVVLKQGGPTKY